MRISKCYITEDTESARVCVNACYDGHISVFWYEVDLEYKDYLCYERTDSFIAALLYYCMTKGLDIVSEGDISRRLLYQLNEVFIPALSNENKEFSAVKIYANTNEEILKSEGHIGTAFSGGVDSFYTILKNREEDQDDMKVSCLTFFKNGFGGSSMYSEILNEKRSEKFSAIADEMGYPFLEVRTNLRYYMPFDPVVSLVTLAAALSIQKYMKYYLFSGTYKSSRFKLTFDHSPNYDMLSVQCFSTENLTFLLAWSEAKRLNKVDYISQFPEVQNYLDVCWCDLGNCTDNYCGKCQRTLLEINALGKLKNFDNVFDVTNFKNNLDRELGVMLQQRKANMSLLYTYEYMFDNGYEFSDESKEFAKKLDNILDGSRYPEIKGYGTRYFAGLRTELMETNDIERISEIKSITNNYFKLKESAVRITPGGYRFNWLRNEIEKKSIAKFLRNRGWMNIAILGNGKPARNLAMKLITGGLEPKYIICVDKKDFDYNCSVEVIGVTDERNTVDVLISIEDKIEINQNNIIINDKEKIILIQDLMRAI